MTLLNAKAPGRHFHANGSTVFGLSTSAPGVQWKATGPITFRDIPDGMISSCISSRDNCECRPKNQQPDNPLQPSVVVYLAAERCHLATAMVCEGPDQPLQSIAVFRSDTNGTTWRFLSVAARGSALPKNSSALHGPSEHTASVLADGSLLVVVRVE
jgi:hypothetical protein